MAATAKLVNVASPSADKINGWEDEVEGWQRSFVRLDLGRGATMAAHERGELAAAAMARVSASAWREQERGRGESGGDCGVMVL
jgi:hypothetical protein